MKYMINVPRRTRTLYIFALSVSLVISFWLAWRETVINSDAICYLLSAQMVGTDGVHQAMQLCNQARWPFYSTLIYGFVQLTHLHYETAAYTLDGFFSLISVASFILVIRELGGSQRTLWLAASVLLLSHQFNSVREYIIRDHGFWAFYLSSMLFLLKYARRPRFKFAFAFNASLILATLFRIEGAVFLVLLPFVSWFQNRYSLRQRARNFLLLYMPVLMMAVLMAGWLAIHPHETVAKFGRVGELIQQVQHGASIIQERYHSAKMELRHSVLGGEAADQADLVIFSAWVAWYLLSVIGNLSWIYAFLVCYAMRARTIILRSTAPIILYWYIGINILVTAGFLAEHLFLSKRYLIALSLVLMLWVPFALDDIIRKWPSLRHRALLSASILFILFSALGGLVDFGYSKSYIHQAGTWVAHRLPKTANIYSNDLQFMYYSRHYGYQIFTDRQQFGDLPALVQGKWKAYDYLALRLDKKEKDENVRLLTELARQPVAVFKNRRGDRIAIYQVARGEVTQ